MVWDRVGDKVGDRVGREVRRKPYLESVGVVFFFLWSFLNTKVFADITCFCIPFLRDARVRPHLTTAPRPTAFMLLKATAKQASTSHELFFFGGTAAPSLLMLYHIHKVVGGFG